MADGAEGPLAEYTALRDEIARRSAHQNQLFTTQLTGAGAIFSFALSSPQRTLLLLIVPAISYLLANRHTAQSHGIFLVTKYIREELADRVPGGLRWDSWLGGQPRRRGPLVSRLPLILSFGGVSAAALSWCAGSVFAAPMSSALRVGAVITWLIGLALTIVTVVTLQNVVGAYRDWWWPTAGKRDDDAPTPAVPPARRPSSPEQTARR